MLKEELIMKETGCDLDQAINALKIANGNFEKGVQIINTLLKYIIALKGKFMIEEKNIYGAFIVISNIKLETFIRHTVVVGCNPVMYHSNLQFNWHDFERNLYALRLEEGVDQELTRKFQIELENGIKNREDDLFYQSLEKHDLGSSEDLLKDIIKRNSSLEEFSLDSPLLSNPEIKIKLVTEELSVSQFNASQETSSVRQSTTPPPASVGESANLSPETKGTIFLKISLEPAGTDGVNVEELKENMIVSVKITDQRDIAQYLSRLLIGEKRATGEIFYSCPIERIEKRASNTIIYVRLGSKIIGVTGPVSNLRVKVIKR